MSEETRTVAPEDAPATKAAGGEQPQPLDDAEAAQVVGGTGSSSEGGFTQEQYDQWESQGTANRSGHGPGSGE